MSEQPHVLHPLRVSQQGDAGRVELIGTFGNDLTVINRARASYRKRSTQMTQRDARLMRYLIREQHYAPTRHCILTFNVSTPLMVFMQWDKHRVGSDLSQSDGAESVIVNRGFDTLEVKSTMSRRYVTGQTTYYIPRDWRAAPAPGQSKQGSGGDLPLLLSSLLTKELTDHISDSEERYLRALDKGVAPEQARLFLPAYALMTDFDWTVSLEGLLNFLHLRLGHDAQDEIRDYAYAIGQLAVSAFPLTLGMYYRYKPVLNRSEQMLYLSAAANIAKAYPQLDDPLDRNEVPF